MTTTRLERLRQLVAKNPDGAFALYGLAMEYKNLRRLDRSAEVFAELSAKHPRYIPAFLHRGGVLLELGRTDEALKVFREGIEVSRAQGDLHAAEELEAALGGI